MGKKNKLNFKERIINDPTRVLTLANLISLLRACSAIPIIYSMAYPDWNWITGVIVLLAILSDALDGYFARRADSVTHFGKWLDPAADFIVIISFLQIMSRNLISLHVNFHFLQSTSMGPFE